MEIKRNKYLELLANKKNNGLIKILIGTRKVGKTTILRQFATLHLKNEVVHTYDFNVYENQNKYRDLDYFNQEILNKLVKDKMNYLFFDEIQEITGWEKIINSISLLKNIDIYITGSNSKLLSSEISTLLTGKNAKIYVYPLSFKEYYDFKNSNEKEKVFQEYIEFGAMPKCCLTEKKSEKNEYLRMLFSDVINNDIINRYKILDIKEFHNIFYFLMENIGTELSINKIGNIIRQKDKSVISNNTISNYIEYLCNCFLCSKINKINIKGKTVLETNYKIYAYDVGIRNSFISSFSFNRGKLLENLVYIELLRNGYEVNVGQDRFIPEVDFVAKKNNEYIYIQVCENLNENNQANEIGNLLKIKDGRKLFISKDYFNKFENGIQMINIIEWLLIEK
ncbi:MAG: ATP-binding protein [Mycoplasmataceae bacterium]|nr:ATP-binding protein [Mycoplasmataceae bacterium]